MNATLRHSCAASAIAQIVVATGTVITLAQGPNNQLAVIPFEVETAVPVTRESIWHTNCRIELNDVQAQEWRRIISSFKKNESIGFDHYRVRVGVRLNAETYYIDKLVVLEDASRNTATPRDDEARERIIATVGLYFDSCERDRLRRQ